MIPERSNSVRREVSPIKWCEGDLWGAAKKELRTRKYRLFSLFWSGLGDIPAVVWVSQPLGQVTVGLVSRSLACEPAGLKRRADKPTVQPGCFCNWQSAMSEPPHGVRRARCRRTANDTNKQRNQEEALQPILDRFRWLGIDWGGF